MKLYITSWKSSMF